ncbi:MAG: twin-arginine translocase TatA/TatE family subunit [Oscillatoriaceae bacterium SKW80]|nr:twin-arginine translocase TatA/TatE family subunit [Oscillatoriaceae bacterium SKYG93]MCX8120177.1 twin-arginine translocase TatA/TatE family subunit [Oscillatoriaceae bacterium SKW80]MDW8453103.1 twin-arginine translocase TatA/TatE family subunit [Oscillatoriaceae cyanobacterium SKYGB_i_bin93]HIK28986.1 twin-arginine translocase TatA/TatE family subunit [Oscillatoriaceae cyanobacterium M7585_C2015_266]
MFGLGWPEMGVIVVVAILIFGPKKIPEIGSALGKSLRSFKEGLRQPEEESENTETKNQ